MPVIATLASGLSPRVRSGRKPESGQALIAPVDAPVPVSGSSSAALSDAVASGYPRRMVARRLSQPTWYRRADFKRLLPAADCQRLAGVRYKPAVLLLMAGEWLRERHRAGGLDALYVHAMDSHLGRLGEVLGGCERIASTPIPFTYAVLIHRTIYCYCALLPFGLVDSIGSMTPVIVAFIAYTFFALEALAAEIEEPFGTAANDLPLDALAGMVEDTLGELLGRPSASPVDTPRSYLVT